MFQRLYHNLVKRKKKQKPQNNPGLSAAENFEQLATQHIASNIEENIKLFREIFNDSSDIVMKSFKISGCQPVKAFLIYIDGMIETPILNSHILQPLMMESPEVPQRAEINKGNVIEITRNHLITVAEVIEVDDMLELVNRILGGEVALLLEGTGTAFAMGLKGWKTRSVEEPQTESVVRGPREGFTENLRTNTSLIRRRVKTSRLKFENMKIGALTKTDVTIGYIEGIANMKVVEEVRNRLSRIKTDSILESGYLEEFIEDNPFTVFPQIDFTERPDKAAAVLVEGHVVIITDTTPMVMIAPVTFPMFMQATEDYYNRWPFGSFIRILRLLSLNVALLLPSLYIAIATFHQEMLPTPLLISIASAREGVPFPAFVEALVMEFTFEVLREGGVRLPRPIGQSISIVGALVIGQAAVTAGLVSPAMVIVVSVTAIANFTIPSINGAIPIRLLRFPMMILAATLGLFGIMAGLMALLIHLCSLRSFGVPYLSPMAPFSLRDFKDFVVRVPWWAMFTRPRTFGYVEPARQEYRQMPRPELRGEKKDAPASQKSEPEANNAHGDAAPNRNKKNRLKTRLQKGGGKNAR